MREVAHSPEAAARPARGPVGTWLATFRPEGARRLDVSAGAGSSHSLATDGPLTVLYDGLLHSRRDWARDFALPAASDAALLLEAYRRFGQSVLDRVKGLFAFVIWDAEKNLLLCARDPHGMHPFFYADADGELLLSASPEALARHPGLPGTIDRGAIANHLCHRWPQLDRTYFVGVRRLAGGYALRVRDAKRTIWRYWDPIPPGRPIDYISEQEVERFPELLDQAVERCLPAGPAGIYLSGGLDSVSVAAVASEHLRERGADPLQALSLVFEHSAANEESRQRAVAEDLGLPLEIVTVNDAVSAGGLLSDALEMSATRAAPMMNLWNPAYAFLSRYGTDHGCEAILTGNGGDEWLEAGVHDARRALTRLDFTTFFEIWAGMQRSYPFTRAQIARNLLWTYTTRPLLRQGGAAVLERVAPETLARQESWRFEQVTPSWVTPDPEVREQLLEGFRMHKRRRSRGALDSPAVAYELEEFYESGHQQGVRLLHPFWDADLTAFLMRCPPRVLMRGGYSKGLVRQSLAQRFPKLSFGRDRKVTASGFYRSVLISEGVEAWKKLGGAQALVELGVVEPVALERHMQELFQQDKAMPTEADPGKAYQIWYVLSLEAWARPRLGRLTDGSPKDSPFGGVD